MAFFQHTVTDKYLSSVDKLKIQEKYILFKAHFHNSEVQQNIRNSKEEQYQEGFLRDLFVAILGYTLNPQNNFNLTTEYKNIKDSKKADGAILIADKVRAVIELKGTDTTDLGKVETQAFGYKNNQPDCVYVITSNFEKLRFYIDNAIDHLEFNLFTLSEKDFELLYLCLAHENLEKGIAKKIKDESISQEDTITKKLYKDYSLFKRELHQNLVQLNPEYNELELFKKSQKLLDRFLFLFFAEDRQLLPPNSVRLILNDWRELQERDEEVPLFNRFRKYFGYLNTGFKGKRYDVFAYNGGLFKPDDILDAVKIDDELLYKHTFTLSEYNFASEVDVNILGHIFENSLNELDEIKAQLEGQEIDKTKTKRKKDGVFYTPKYITKYIVENTIGKLCAEKKAELQINDADYTADHRIQKKTKQAHLDKLTTYREWLLQLTICDPACGSGAFLNQALDFLIAEHRYVDELQAKLFGDSLVLSDVEKSILEHNIFGVDLNEESVEIAKLSLWLRTAQPNRKLNDLNNNIKCGNSLIDDPEVAGDKAFNWQQAFPHVFEKGGFDVVIGNPPYVRQEMLPKTEKEYYIDKFKVGNGVADLYVYFYETALNILVNDGYLGFITPNKFYKTKYGKELRQFLINFKIIELIDFFELKVFEDASTDSQITIIRKNNHTTEFLYFPIKQISDFRNNSYSGIEINPINLSDEIWVFNDKIELAILEKMQKNSVSLKEYTNNGIEYGIKTGLNEAFIIDEEIKNQIIKEDPKSAELIKPYVSGTEIEKYFINYNQKYIITTFPAKNIDIEEYKGVKNYLLLNFGKERLSQTGEQGSRKKTNGKWYETQDSIKYYSSFEKKKIIYIHTAVNHKFYYDEEGYYINNSCYLISNVDKFLSVWLNSQIFTFYKKLNFVAYGDSSESGRAKLDYNKMVNVPIPILSEDLKQPFIEKADVMLNLHKDLQSIGSKFLALLSSELGLEQVSKKMEDWYLLTFGEFTAELKKQKIDLSLAQKSEWMDFFETEKTKATTIKTQITQTDAQIDRMVYALYELTEEEIKIVEGV